MYAKIAMGGSSYDVIFPSDYMIERMIQENLLQKINWENIPNVANIDERFLDLRAFPDDIKLAVWERQNHVCPLCHKEFDIALMEGDHITPWRDGGRTIVENCQMLCRECNRRKGAK